MLISFLIAELIGLIGTLSGLALLKYDPMNLYGEDKGISFDLKDLPWGV